MWLGLRLELECRVIELGSGSRFVVGVRVMGLECRVIEFELGSDTKKKKKRIRRYIPTKTTVIQKKLLRIYFCSFIYLIKNK